MDARSACLAVIQVAPVEGNVASQVASFRQLGAPIVLVLKPRSLEFWKQRESEAVLVEEVAANKAEAYFRSHATELGPDAVFRAKTWGRLDRQFQLTFVDAGLMPLVEMEMGQHLTNLIGRVYQGLRRAIRPKKNDVSVEQGHWLIKASFWLLAAKILRDKRVRNFVTLDFRQVDDVFARVARHYHSRHTGLGIEIPNQKYRQAIEEAAQEIANFGHLGHVTTESLSHVYESALITPEVRKALGTHSTPQYLVDYVVWKLRPWIEEIPQGDRHVFEPACGHAAFLVAAIRLLKDLLQDKQVNRKQYLRTHLHGIEVDSFAVEIARLSLTLADIPNPNGWDLTCDDMFTKSLLGKKAGEATIVLGNPPFEKFTKYEREAYKNQGSPVACANKTAEVLAQVLPRLPLGGVFGFIVPQGFLQGSTSQDVRSFICQNAEIQEICLFPDKVFSFSDAESAIILGRRVARPSLVRNVLYRRVRESDMAGFRQDYKDTACQVVPQGRLCAMPAAEMRLPDLVHVWDALDMPVQLSTLVEVGKGFEFKGRDLPANALTIADSKQEGVPGFVNFDAKTIFELPTEHKVILDRRIIRRPGTGVKTGVPQVLVNYAPVSRGPWRLRAVIDYQGHPVTSRFITVRPKCQYLTLEFLWAILNSPVANAYAFCHSDKRQTRVGTLRKLPIPVVSTQQVAVITSLANQVRENACSLTLLSGHTAEQDQLKNLLLALDAEILNLYDLSPRLERELLDYFAGQQREGVCCSFDRYYPAEFEPRLHLHEFLSEEFHNSQASILLQSHRSFASPEISEALRCAREDFED